MTEEWRKYTLAVLEHDASELTTKIDLLKKTSGKGVKDDIDSLMAALKELNKEYDRTAKPAGFTP